MRLGSLTWFSARATRVFYGDIDFSRETCSGRKELATLAKWLLIRVSARQQLSKDEMIAMELEFN
jgi:hypothetical protein